MLFWVTAACAAELMLASPVFEDEASAVSYEDLVSREGARGEVRRIYQTGAGWRWQFRTLPLRESDARRMQERLNEAGLLMHILSLGANMPLPSETERAPSSEGLEQFLRRVARAHVGKDGTGWRPNGPASFVFDRTLADGRTYRHAYVRAQGRTQLVIVDRARKTVILDIAVQGEEVLVREPVAGTPGEAPTRDRALQLVERFAPESVLDLPLRLSSGTAPLSEQPWLRAIPGTDGENATTRLAYDGGAGERGRVTVFTTDNARLRSTSEANSPHALTLQYEDWTAGDEAPPYPQRSRATRRGEVVDTVDVLLLSQEPEGKRVAAFLDATRK